MSGYDQACLMKITGKVGIWLLKIWRNIMTRKSVCVWRQINQVFSLTIFPVRPGSLAVDRYPSPVWWRSMGGSSIVVIFALPLRLVEWRKCLCNTMSKCWIYDVNLRTYYSLSLISPSCIFSATEPFPAPVFPTPSLEWTIGITGSRVRERLMLPSPPRPLET